MHLVHRGDDEGSESRALRENPRFRRNLRHAWRLSKKALSLSLCPAFSLASSRHFVLASRPAAFVLFGGFVLFAKTHLNNVAVHYAPMTLALLYEGRVAGCSRGSLTLSGFTTGSSRDIFPRRHLLSLPVSVSFLFFWECATLGFRGFMPAFMAHVKAVINKCENNGRTPPPDSSGLN